MTNSRLTDPEVLEWRFPVRLERISHSRAAAAAPAAHRGGDGGERRVRFLEPMTAVDARQPPAGAAVRRGRRRAGRGRPQLGRAQSTATREEFGATFEVEMNAGDVFVIQTPGGGGFGAPRNAAGRARALASRACAAAHNRRASICPRDSDGRRLRFLGRPTSTASTQKLDQYKDKVLLIVNTASKCGFTPQYKGLEALYKKMHAHGLEVLGFPCNQFGAQEPGSEDEIESFCEINYGVTFPLFAKVDVNGDERRAALPVSEEGEARPARLRGDQVELHQVPGRPQGQGRRALRAERRARGDRRRHRKAAVDADVAPSWRAIAAALACARARVRVAPAHAADPEQGAARVVPDRRDGLRSAGRAATSIRTTSIA